MELKELRPNEQEKYSTTKEVVGLGCTDTAIRRGRTKLGCTRETLLKYIRWYESEDISLFSHHNKGHKPVTTKPEETRKMEKKLRLVARKENLSKEGRRLIIQIMDTGVGIDASKLNQIQFDGKQHIGVMNISDRLKHYYKGKANLALSRTSEEGRTKATISLPIKAGGSGIGKTSQP